MMQTAGPSGPTFLTETETSMETTQKAEVKEAQKPKTRDNGKTDPTGIGVLDQLLDYSRVNIDAAIIVCLKVTQQNPKLGARILEYLDTGDGIRHLRKAEDLFDEDLRDANLDEYEALCWLAVDAGLTVKSSK